MAITLIPVPATPLDERIADARLARGCGELTRFLMGDPAPWRSALDRRTKPIDTRRILLKTKAVEELPPPSTAT
jgi:hypothetical protein